MTGVTQLLQRPDNAPLAWLSISLTGLDVPADGLVLSNTQFLAHVSRVCERLPEGEYAINLCDNRYVFMVALAAVMLAKQTNLLPSNKNLLTQQALIQRYRNTYVLHDGRAKLPDDAQAIDLSDMDWSLGEFNEEIPKIDLDHLALISFTSGSTGEPKANLKSWRTLQESSRINARYMMPDHHRGVYHLATVPGQHMWGLETSVLLPLFANACLVDARPLFPYDILSLLRKLPVPRTVIATPLHLRALLASQVNSDEPAPSLANILCATAPLDQSLAQGLEDVFQTQLREVYGCSEVGSMAIRRAARTHIWSQFQGLNFAVDEHGHTNVSADYLPELIKLDDKLELRSGEQFTLSGRAGDQVKIAGKRGSLSEVNAVLNKFPDLLDGVVFFPPQDRPVPRLVAIVALANGSKTELRQHFQAHLDSAFVPRPIYLVDALPREENGKLVRARLNELYQNLSD